MDMDTARSWIESEASLGVTDPCKFQSWDDDTSTTPEHKDLDGMVRYAAYRAAADDSNGLAGVLTVCIETPDGKRHVIDAAVQPEDIHTSDEDWAV
jgi:hypothetical protein